MDSDTSKSLPWWLTEQTIINLRRRVRDCSNPYSDEEMDAIEYDGAYDPIRYDAHEAKRILLKYGIPLTDEESTTE